MLKSPRLFGGFLAGWTLLNLLQAGTTELFHDEAYYWIYSRELSWGYYDHAPMVALFIRLGSSLFQGELGVRLLMVLASSLTLLFLWLSTDRKQPLLLLAIAMPMVLVQVGGFFAAPDTCLILFTAMFLWAYQRYLKTDGLIEGLGVMVLAALMLYSKYHGLMILFFCTLGNLGLLLRRRSFWWILPGVVLLFLPHLQWAYQHGFATLFYHLGERSPRPYSVDYTLEYLAAEWALAGPLTGLIVFFAAFRTKTADAFGRALKFCLFGVLGFLFLLTFNGRIEANWAATAFLPLILLSYRFLAEKETLRRWLFRLAVPSVALVLILRLYLAWDFMPELRKFRNEFHGWKDWAQQIRSIAGDRPVVIKDSYQYASKYAFYSGKTGFSFNSATYRSNQFDLSSIEESLQGKSVLFVAQDTFFLPSEYDTLRTAKGDRFFYAFLDNFHSYQKLSLEVLADELRFPAGSLAEIPYRLTSPYAYPIDFGQHPEQKVLPSYKLSVKGYTTALQPMPPDLGSLRFDRSYESSFRFPVPRNPGTYTVMFGLQVGWLPPGRQGKTLRLVVE